MNIFEKIIEKLICNHKYELIDARRVTYTNDLGSKWVKLVYIFKCSECGKIKKRTVKL